MGAEHPQRRADDKPETRWQHTKRVLIRENWYRDVWMCGLTGLMLYVAIALTGIVSDVEDAQQRIQSGRKFSVEVICTATSAVIDAGRETIIGGAAGVGGEFAKNLEALGYPPRKVREDQADKAAEAYANAISRRVEQRTGVRGVVRDDGTLNCERLNELARVTP